MINKKAIEYGAQGSAIRELFEFGKRLKKQVGDENVYDFSIGNPSIPAPKKYNDALISLLSSDDTLKVHSYTSSYGDDEAREAIASDLNNRYKAKVDPKLIYLTCGAAAGLTISLKALCNKGDNIIVIAPFFPEYKVFADNAEAKLKIAKSDKNMKPDLKDLEKKINVKTKVVIIDSPNNPTGAVYTEEDILKLTSLLSKKEKEFGHPIYLLSDEPYRELIYDNIKYPFITNYYKNSLITYSFSKSLSLPGERIGYVIVNSEAEDAQTVYNAIKGAGRLMGFICAPSLFQHAVKLTTGLLGDISKYKENRDLIYEMLTGLGYEVIHPDGAFYLFLKAPNKDEQEFSDRAKKFNLLLVPSTSFGVKGYVRISYCVSKSMIERSYNSFKQLKESY